MAVKEKDLEVNINNIGINFGHLSECKPHQETMRRTLKMMKNLKANKKVIIWDVITPSRSTTMPY